MKIPVSMSNGNGTKWIPIVIQTIVLLGSIFIYAMHSEGRLSTLEQGQKDIEQQVLELDRRVNAYFDRH